MEKPESLFTILPPKSLVKQFPQFPAVNDYGALPDSIRARL